MGASYVGSRSRDPSGLAVKLMNDVLYLKYGGRNEREMKSTYVEEGEGVLLDRDQGAGMRSRGAPLDA